MEGCALEVCHLQWCHDRQAPSFRLSFRLSELALVFLVGRAGINDRVQHVAALQRGPKEWFGPFFGPGPAARHVCGGPAITPGRRIKFQVQTTRPRLLCQARCWLCLVKPVGPREALCSGRVGPNERPMPPWRQEVGVIRIGASLACQPGTQSLPRPRDFVDEHEHARAPEMACARTLGKRKRMHADPLWV